MESGIEVSSSAGHGITPISLDELWKRHEFFDGLFQFYLDKIMQFHTFYLPIVGGVVAYVLKNTTRQSAFGLLIPLAVSIGAVWIFVVARHEAEELNGALRANSEALGILPPPARLLVHSVFPFFGASSLFLF